MKFNIKIFVDNNDSRCFKKSGAEVLKILKEDIEKFLCICVGYKNIFIHTKTLPFTKDFNGLIIARCYLEIDKVGRKTVSKKVLLETVRKSGIKIGEL